MLLQYQEMLSGTALDLVTRIIGPPAACFIHRCLNTLQLGLLASVYAGLTYYFISLW